MPEKPKVLVVEDDEGWGEMYEEEIEERKGDPDVCGSAREAVEKLREGGPFAGVITDGLEGGWRAVYEAASAVGVPVLVITGDMDLVEELRSQGIPVTSKDEDIFDAVDRFMEGLSDGASSR